MRFVFKIKSVEIFFLKDIEIFDSIKTISFLIFLTSFFFRLRFLRLFSFVLSFFVAFFVLAFRLISLFSKNSLLFFSFLFFVLFFVASLSNLFLENLSSLFSSSLDSCFKTRSLRKIVDFVDLSIAISFLSLTKILCLSLTR